MLNQNHNVMETKKFIYIGVRLSHGESKKTFNYLPITETGFDADNRACFAKRLVGFEVVGSVIECNVNGSTFIGAKLSEFTIAPEHPAHEQITYWSAESRSAQLKYDRLLELKRNHPKSVDALIDELRDSMSNMGIKERAAFAMYVYNKLI